MDTDEERKFSERGGQGASVRTLDKNMECGDLSPLFAACADSSAKQSRVLRLGEVRADAFDGDKSLAEKRRELAALHIA